MNAEHDALLAFIKRNEGLKLKPYRCPAGFWTIGFGYNMEAHGIPARLVDKIITGRGITKEDAEKLLITEVAECISDCKRMIPSFQTLTENRKIALVDMCFNLGSLGLSKFKNMLAAINAGDWERAWKSAQASKWYQQVKSRGPRVVKLIREG